MEGWKEKSKSSRDGLFRFRVLNDLFSLTLAELIFVIEQLKFQCGSSGEYYLIRALADVELKRGEKKYEEAERISACASQKRQACVDLLTPCDGKQLADIPSVLKKTDTAMKEAQEADRKWNKIMWI